MFCLRFSLDPVLHHDHQHVVVQICSVQFVQKLTANKHMEHFSNAKHETGRNLLKFSTNLGFYRFKDYLFIWARNDGYSLWLYFPPSPFSFFSWSFCRTSTQHNTNVMKNYKKGRGAHQNRQVCKEVLFKRRFIYIFSLEHVLIWSLKVC